MNWRNIQKNNFTRINALADFLQLGEEQKKQLLHIPSFPLNVPRRLAEKMEKGTLEDPILKQFLPTLREEFSSDTFYRDPVDDAAFQITPKLLKKYDGRALLLSTSACAMHCRYCFRQNFDYEVATKGFEEEMLSLKRDPSIKEIILSGGDPLSLSDSVLCQLLEDLSEISHINIIRLHTRFPIGIPERITEKLLDTFNTKQIVFIIHCNHPKELDEDVLRAMRDVKNAGAILLNQSVLLKEINDDITTLKDLSWKLLEGGVIPYYLHQFDPIQGGMHFAVSEQKGLKLIQAMRESLPGYAVPQYVQEIPHQKGKTVLHPFKSLKTENFESFREDSSCELTKK